MGRRVPTDAVRKMRRYSADGYRVSEIAGSFGWHESVVRRIVNRETYQHVADDTSTAELPPLAVVKYGPKAGLERRANALIDKLAPRE